jgi:hypothetical protein
MDTATKLPRDAKALLDSQMSMLGTGLGDRVLVTFFVQKPESRAQAALRGKREQAIRSYLAAKGLPANRLSVRRQVRPSPPAHARRPRLAPAQVELVSGCG